VTEQTMTITPILFILIILLFGFDLTGHVEIPRETTITANEKRPRGNIRARNSEIF
jgi:hypothetical protein